MIGLTKTEVQKQMLVNFPKFAANFFGISTNINTLKYIDSKTDRTLIFYFTKENKCQYSKMIEDMDLIDARIKEFNIKYKPNGTLQWTESKNGKNYKIKIEKEEYIFNVIISE
ncbi:MAG: hypothetical protein COX07_01245 [Bacteroidetes bacterium CG23_combo_of_CG06-09_8_20_14_all_32_9]|nr:MAG: hypothetical protein COX07_01245 [Bacteroidetes bacterium CG23_combo_of_CG06-09_8_20_14_all_32_9]